MEKDRRSRLHNQQRLRELKREHPKAVRVMSSHDVEEFERAARRHAHEPPATVHAI